MASPYATGVDQLILEAKENPAVPVVDKLLNRGDRMLIHGYEETYKSGFAIELARCISTGKPFFGELEVPRPLRVGIIDASYNSSCTKPSQVWRRRMTPRLRQPGLVSAHLASPEVFRHHADFLAWGRVPNKRAMTQVEESSNPHGPES